MSVEIDHKGAALYASHLYEVLRSDNPRFLLGNQVTRSVLMSLLVDLASELPGEFGARMRAAVDELGAGR